MVVGIPAVLAPLPPRTVLDAGWLRRSVFSWHTASSLPRRRGTPGWLPKQMQACAVGQCPPGRCGSGASCMSVERRDKADGPAAHEPGTRTLYTGFAAGPASRLLVLTVLEDMCALLLSMFTCLGCP